MIKLALSIFEILKMLITKVKNNKQKKNINLNSKIEEKADKEKILDNN